MNYIQKAKRVLFDKNARFDSLVRHGFYNYMSDEKYLKMLFRMRTGYELNLENSKSFNEKLQWLKLHDRREIYTSMVDKYEGKQYIAKEIGEQYIIPTIGVWECFDDIDFEKLPNQFVLKTTHDSGGVVICQNKEKFDYVMAKTKIENSLRTNIYWVGREWPYKGVRPRIIAEKFMVDNNEGDIQQELTDYKLMCFNGKVKCSFTCTERFGGNGLKVTFFDENWEEMPFERLYPKSTKKIPKPKNYDLMVEIAEKLAKGMPFVRVDFYEADGRIFVGELTLYPGSGMEEFNPVIWDYKLASCIMLGIIFKNAEKYELNLLKNKRVQRIGDLL